MEFRILIVIVSVFIIKNFNRLFRKFSEQGRGTRGLRFFSLFFTKQTQNEKKKKKKD